MGLSLNVDLEAFKKEWEDKQADIQKIINSHTFNVKIGGIQGLTEVQAEMERFARGVRASSKVDLVNTDSIKGLKDEIRALEITWSGLSEAQKYANKETGQLTEFAASLAQRYGTLTTQLKEYGLTLKETTKDQQKLAQAQQNVFDSLRKDAYQSMGQQDFGIAQLNEYYRQLEESSRRTKELSDAEAQRGAARYRESQRIQQERQRELQLQQEEYEALRRQLREEAKLASAQKNRRDNERYTSQQRRISEGKRIQQILSTEAKTLDAINQRLAIQRQRLGQATIGSAQYKKIEKDIAALEARLRSLSGTQQRSVSATNAQTAAFQRQSGVLNGLKQFMNSYISLLGGYRLFSNIKQITSEFELQRVSLRAITQDAAFADSLFAKIKTTATESPFATKELVTYTKQLAAYRIENEQLYGTMNMLADVSAGLGVSMDRLILAYGQVKAASVLRGTELRQFTEAGIPLVDELAKKFSQLRGEVVSTGEVFDLISTRQVPFEMVADIFKEMTAEGGRFYEMQKKQSESLYGVFEKLKDVIQNTFDEIGQSNRGLLMGIGKLATVGAKNFNILTSALAPLIVGMGAYRAATVLATKGTLGLSLSSNLLARAEQSLALAGRRVMIGRAKSVGLLKKAKAANDAYALSVIRAYRATNIFAKSFHLLKAAIIANPIGAIITALTAAYSALSAYSDNLASVSGAHERAAKTIEETKKAIESEPKFTAFKSLSNDLKKQESLLKSTKLSYKEFMKIYPELAKEFKSEADWKKALNSADVERQKILSQIKDAYPEYFSYLDIEKGKVEDLAKGYAKIEESMRLKQAASLEDRAQGLDADIEKLEGKRDSWWRKFWYGSDMKLFGVDAPFLAELAGKQEEVKAIRTEIDALKKASQDASEAAVKWRQNYKQLVMGGFMDNQALATLQFGDAVENAQKKANELKEEIAQLERVPMAELDPHLEKRLATLKEDYADIVKFLKMYNQELDKISKKTAKTQLQELRSEFQMVQKIYKEYEDLRKVLGDAAAAEEIKKAYSSVTNIDFLSPSLYKKRLKMLADAVTKIHVTIRKSSADLTGQQISDTKKWTKAYEEQLKIWEQSGVVATKAYKVKGKDGKPQGNWTVGWGFEFLIDEAGNWKKVTEDTTMTLEEANKQLELQLQYRSSLLDKVLSTYQDLELTANQYSALLDIVYNTVGQQKNVDKVLKAAEGDINKIPEVLKDAFTRAAATGEQMPGLVDRAASRAAMFAADLSSAISQQFSKISIDNIEQLPSHLAMLIRKAIGDVDIDGITQRMEAMLNKLSQQIKQQQDASDFFEKMLGLTGDVELSTKLALAVTGVTVSDEGIGGLFSQKLAEILAQEPVAVAVPTDFQIEGDWNVDNIQRAINSGKVTVAQIRDVIENLRATGKKDLAKTLEESLDQLSNYSGNALSKMYDVLKQYDAIEQQRINITSNANNQIKALENGLVEAAKSMSDEELSALRERTKKAIEGINAAAKLELFKLEDDYIRFFTSIYSMSVENAVKMKDKIREQLYETFAKGGIGIEELRRQLRALDAQFEKLEDRRSLFGSYLEGGVDKLISKYKELGENISDVGARISQLDDPSKISSDDKSYVDTLLQKFKPKVDGKSISSYDELAEVAGGQTEKMGSIVQDLGQGMQTAAQGVSGALMIVDRIIKDVHSTITGIQGLIDQLNEVRSEDNKVGDWFKYISDFDKYAFSGWEKLKSGDVIGAIFDTVSSIVSIFNNVQRDKVKRLNKEIENQADIIRDLEHAYTRLQEAQEGFVGSDWVRNQQHQLQNLQKQIEATRKQIEAEKAKGKSSEKDAIQDYEDTLLDLEAQYREAQRSIIEEMSGTNLGSAAKDFAKTWLDAYLSFEDTMESVKGSFKDMMSSLVQNSMMAKLVQKRLEPVFEAIDKAYEDAELTPAEWQSIMDMGNKAIEYIDEDLTHLAEMLNLREQLGDATQSDLTGIAKGVAQASEETVLTLAGYANSILYYQIWLKNDVAAIRAILEGKVAAVSPAPTGEGGFNVGQLISLQQQSLTQLQAINANTGRSADSLSRLEDKIDSIISTAGTSSRKVVNTRLSN